MTHCLRIRLCKFGPLSSKENWVICPTVCTVFEIWGPKYTSQPGLRRQNFVGYLVHYIWHKKFWPTKTGSGRFWGVTPQLWGPLAPPLIGLGGRGLCQMAYLDEVNKRGNFRENRISQSRDICTWCFYAGPLYRPKSKGTDSWNKVLHKLHSNIYFIHSSFLSPNLFIFTARRCASAIYAFWPCGSCLSVSARLSNRLEWNEKD